MTWQSGDCLQSGKYLILEELGEGGFGITYKAKHTHFNKVMVIKTPNDSLKNDPNYPRFVERFIEEGRKIESLNHPHIVRATDLFYEGTLPCLAMDFVEGENLFKIVEKKLLSEAKALEYIRQIGDALCVVHEVGMVHRDAHPANIMVKPDGNAVLIDFGLAADVAAAIPSSSHPANRAFAPYEQETGNGLPTVDVYTLAATLYFIVTRRPPTTAVDRKFNKLALAEPKSFNSNISKELNSAILKGMQLESRNRPQSMRAWLDLLPNSQETVSNSLKLPVGLIVIVLAISGGFIIWQLVRPPVNSPTVITSPSSSPSPKEMVSSKTAEEFFNDGLIKANSKDYKGAIADYNEAIRLKPDYDFAYVNRGNAKYGLGDKQGAITDYNEAIRLNLDYSLAYYNRGSAKYDLGDKQGAITDYTKAIKTNQNWGNRSLANVYYSRGIAKYALGDNQGAISDYNEAIRLNPTYTFAYVGRGLVKFNLGDYQGATIDYNEAIRINPNNADPYVNRGTTKYSLGDKQGAITDYSEAIRLNPNFAMAYNNRGSTKNNLGDKQGAISDYNEAIRLKPDYSLAYTNRGIAKRLLGDKQGAIIDHTKAIEINQNWENSNLANAYHGRGITKSDLGDKQGAIADYNEAIRLNPDFALAHMSLGVAKYDLGDKEGAITNYIKAIRLKPNSADPYYNLGLAKSDLGDKQGALADFRKASELYQQQGNTELYNKSLDKIRELGG